MEAFQYQRQSLEPGSEVNRKATWRGGWSSQLRALSLSALRLIERSGGTEGRGNESKTKLGWRLWEVSGSLGGLQLPKICPVFTFRCIARAKVAVAPLSRSGCCLAPHSHSFWTAQALLQEWQFVQTLFLLLDWIETALTNSGLLAGQVQKPSERHPSPGPPSSACY